MTKTAIEQYEQRLAEARELLKKIEAGLDAHSARAHKKPRDWGYAGDLGALVEMLSEAAKIAR